MRLLLTFLAMHLLAFSTIAQITPAAGLPYKGTKEKEKGVADTSGKAVIPGNKVPYTPKPELSLESLNERINNLEGTLENRAPYAGMDILEITFSSDSYPPFTSLLTPGAYGVVREVTPNDNKRSRVIRLDHSLTNGNPTASIFVSFKNKTEPTIERFSRAYYVSGSWYVEISSISVEVQPYKITPSPKILATPNIYVLRRLSDKEEQGYESQLGGPAVIRWSPITAGEKIELLIFAKKPSLKESIKGVPVKKEQSPLLKPKQ